jgi:hypothetical protein
MSLTPNPDAVPHEGEEGRPAPLPPQRYEGAGGGEVLQPTPPAPPAPARATGKPGPSTLDRLQAVSGPLSFALFMVCGFALGGWAWSWLFFLLPGIVYAWNRAGHDD